MTSVSNTLNVLLVDDERKACNNLKQLLQEHAGASISVIGMAHSTNEAELLITTLHPEAVFLDIEMPNENAFSFLERISPVTFEVIFVTAYNEYAVKAFRLNALDYILKPISITELINATRKLKEKIAEKKLYGLPQPNFPEVGHLIANKAKPNKLNFIENNQYIFVNFTDIIYLEAITSQSQVIYISGSGFKKSTINTSFAELEETLPNDQFYRLHRSYIINCQHLKKIDKEDQLNVLMHQQLKVPVSRRKISLLVKHLANHGYKHE